MSEDERSEEQDRPTTSPAEGNPKDGTTPPGEGDLDEDALERGQEKLDQAGGGH